MSLKACFDRAATMGVITRDEAEQLKARFDEIASETTDTALARARMQQEVEAEAQHRERAALLTEIKRAAILDALPAYRTEAGATDLLEAWMAMHENMGRAGTFVQDAEGKRDAIVKAAQQEMKAVISELGRKAVLGDLSRTRGQQKARMDNVVRELFGEDSGDARAKIMAQAFSKVAEDLRVRFNAAGGAIGKLERWGLPQGHNADALRDFGKEPWVAYMKTEGVLDRDRTVHPVTGLRMTDAELTAALNAIWDKIVTDGWANRDVTAQPAGRGALYTQHADHRFLHFKDAKAWMAYADRFGSRDAFATMMGHVGGMARDIAHMETFGPNPNAMRTYVANWIRSQMLTPGADRATVARVNRALGTADSMWGQMRGEEPVDQAFADRMASARNFISATSLGAAWISSLSDPASGQDARLRLGMAFGAGLGRAGILRVIAGTFADMLAAGRREDAIDAMLGLDSAANVLARQSREVAGFDHRFWTGWIADRTLNWGLLAPWTQSGKHLMGFDIMTFLGDNAGRSFGELPERLRDSLRSHGFDAAEWDAIRSVPLHGGRRLRATEIMSVDRELAERYVQMISREMKFAVPEATIGSRAWMTETKKGTLPGEIVRSMMQFKGFAMAVLVLKLIPVAKDIISRNPSRMGVGAAFLLTSTVLGAVAMALKDVKDGRDPRKWLDEKTWLDPQHWGAAFLQAGGLGIYGDFLTSETNRFGGGLAGTAAGPLVGRVGDFISVTAEVDAAIKGKKTNFSRWGVQQLRRNVPFVNHWATSKLYQAAVMDELQRMADPEAAAAFARTRQKRMRDYRQDFYWPPGSPLPQRAPDFSRVMATR